MPVECAADILDALGMGNRKITTGAICVYHRFVATAVEALEGTGIPVAAVSTGFPAGLSPHATKVKEIEWETGRMPDRLHPDDLLLRATLQVYKFKPTSPPGSSDCSKEDMEGPAQGFGPESDPGTEPGAPE